MKYFRTAFLPLLLCGVILLSGYLSPLLFNLFTPDPKNKVESVPISTEDNPMYLESVNEVILPPWDEIDTDEAGYLLETYAIPDDAYVALSGRMEADIEALFPGITTKSSYHAMTEVMRIYDDHLLFLQDHLGDFCLDASGEEASYKLDYVMDGWNIFPISLHLKGEETAPVTDESALRDSLDQLTSVLRQGVRSGIDPDPIDTLDIMYVGKYTEPLTAVFKGLLSHDEVSKQVWLSIIINCRKVYTLTHNNETLLVMVDAENLISCLFFDANSNRITGYSLDPQLVSLSMDTTRILP